jgi:hypothetical protein
MARSRKTDIIGLIAMIVGPPLVMGGLMVCLVVALSAPRILLVPALVQIALGLLTAATGFFMWRGHERAVWILLLLGIAVVVNGVFYAVLLVSTAPPHGVAAMGVMYTTWSLCPLTSALPSGVNVTQ